MLVMSINPPQTLLFDFGKVTKKRSSDDPCIGLAYSVAPEVGHGIYTYKIDIWAWSHAACIVLGVVTSYGKLEGKRYDQTIARLQQLESEVSAYAKIWRLLALMLRLKPNQRPSADAALSADFWSYLDKPAPAPEATAPEQRQDQSPPREGVRASHFHGSEDPAAAADKSSKPLEGQNGKEIDNAISSEDVDLSKEHGFESESEDAEEEEKNGDIKAEDSNGGMRSNDTDAAGDQNFLGHSLPAKALIED